jgi:hypothetical protein
VLSAHCLLFCGLDVVSFEQFCINLANEKLQQHFNQVFFNIYLSPLIHGLYGLPLGRISSWHLKAVWQSWGSFLINKSIMTVFTGGF